MHRIIRLLLTGLLIANVCQAQFTATGGANDSPYVYTPASGTGLDRVYVFDGLENARLIFTADSPSDVKWYRYEQNPSAAVELTSDVQISATETVLTNVQAGYGYYTETSGGLRHYVYVIAYVPVEYMDINPCSNCDVCNILELTASVGQTEDLVYYTTGGARVVLKRQYTLSWNTLEWNVSDKIYLTKTMTTAPQSTPYWSISAPLTDTYFTFGDQFAWAFEKPVVSRSIYNAVAVKTNADWEIELRTADNELEKVSSTGDLSGSAPLNVQFYSRPSDAVQSYIWKVYDSTDGSGEVKRYTTEENLKHSFQDAGIAMVKVYVSSVNGTCTDSATFTPNISASHLDCPNFFTPRSSPGENDEFKVAYKSIISFKGVIVNRWGNVLFEWSDPAQGWDGTFKGKAVSPGVYFYLIDAKGSDGLVYKKKGDINLLE